MNIRFGTNPTRTVVAIIVIACALAAVWWLFGSPFGQLGNSSGFFFFENGAPSRFELSGNNLSQAPFNQGETPAHFVLSTRADGMEAYLDARAGTSSPELFSAFASSTPRDLGPAFAAAFSVKPGVLIAITPKGVERVNADNGGRDTLLERPDLPVGKSAVAPDGSAIVLENAVTHALDVFSVDTLRADATSYIASLSVEGDAVAFTDATHFIVKTGNTYSVYSINADSLTKTATPSL